MTLYLSQTGAQKNIEVNIPVLVFTVDPRHA